MEPKKYTIDAKGKSFGRIASETAALLRGKSEVSFSPEKIPGVHVHVTNIGAIRFTGNNKMRSKLLRHHTMHPGGLRTITLEHAWQKNPERVFNNTVASMLPRTRWRKEMMKLLTVTV